MAGVEISAGQTINLSKINIFRRMQGDDKAEANVFLTGIYIQLTVLK